MFLIKKSQFIILTLLCIFTMSAADINLYINDPARLGEQISGKPDLQKLIIIDNFIKEYPQNPAYYKMKAKIELSIKDYKSALETSLKGLTLNNDDGDLLTIAGMCYFFTGDRNNAGIYYQKALKSGNQSAAFLLTLLDNNSINITQQTVQTRPEQQTNRTPDYKALEKSYIKDNTNDQTDYIYLHQNTDIIIKSEDTYDYTVTGAARVNTLKGSAEFKDFSISFDSFLFSPYEITGSIIQPDGSENVIPAKNLVVADKKEDGNIFSNKKYIMIPFADIKPGSIVNYTIHFKSTGKRSVDKFSYRHYFGSYSGVYQKSLRIYGNPAVKLHTKVSGTEIKTREYSENGLPVIQYTMQNVPAFDLRNESIPFYDISPFVYMSTYNGYGELAAELDRKLSGIINTKSAPANLKINPEMSKKEIIDAIYSYIQQNIEYKAIEIGENAIIPRQPAETLSSKYGDCKDQAVLFINLLGKFNIKSYPAYIPTYDQGTPDSDIPALNYYNHMIVFIPQQDGVENGFFADTTSAGTPLYNLPYQIQGVESLVIKNSGGYETIKTPIISHTANVMSDSYTMNVDVIGRGTLKYKQLITGSFSEFYRSQNALKTKQEIISEVYNNNKRGFPLLKESDLSINGLNKNSGDITIEYKTDAKALTEVFFDGKQIININTESLKDWINLPANPKYTFRKNFAYTYKKEMDIILPKGYRITDQNVSNVKKDNQYITFNMFVDKIADNHIRVEWEFALKTIFIEPEDLDSLNKLLAGIIYGIKYKIVMEDTNYNYENFYDAAMEEYNTADIYKNYISRLISNKNIEKALATAKAGQAKFPKDSYFYIMIGLLNFDKENYSEAEYMLLEAQNIDPENQNIYFYLIDTYKKIGDPEKLEKLLKKAISTLPKVGKFYSELSEFYRMNDNIEKSIEILGAACKMFPDSPIFYIDLGYIHSINKDIDSAEASYRKALEIDPKSGPAYNNLAWLYCENKIKLTEAVTFAEKACEITPLSDSFLDTLAEAYFLNGMYDKAIAAIKKAIKINPNYTYLEQQLKKIEDAKIRAGNK